jgi:hypothetical protein
MAWALTTLSSMTNVRTSVNNKENDFFIVSPFLGFSNSIFHHKELKCNNTLG